jgi:hypothetical protein
MKKKIVYTDEPMGDVQVVTDFLPSPAELALDSYVQAQATVTNPTKPAVRKRAPIQVP